jgi:hypothetical protein
MKIKWIRSCKKKTSQEIGAGLWRITHTRNIKET